MNAHRRVITALRIAGAAAVMLPLMLMSAAGAGAQEQTPATISVTVYTCPPGMTADTLVADDCAVATAGFDIVVVSLTGLQEPLTIADAGFDGTSYIWSPGPAAAPRFTGANYGIRESALPDGYTAYVVLGDSVVDFDGRFAGLRITTAAPDVAITIYNFTDAGGGGNQEPPPVEPGTVDALPATGVGFDGGDGTGWPWALVAALGSVAGTGAIGALIYTSRAAMREHAGFRRASSYRDNSWH